MSTPPPNTKPEPGSLAELGEFAAIGRFVARLHQAPSTLVGPGDDSAVIAAPDGRVAISTDMLVDGVHFRTDWASGVQIGQRAALAAMADVAAMGAAPTAVVVAMGAPPDTRVDLLDALATGMREAVEGAGASIVGGDLARANALTLAVTVLGDLAGAKPVLRSGARAGDEVAVNGRLGWAAAGLAVLSRGFRSPAALVNAYKVPEPPLAAGPVAAAAGATAMIDVSDGLLADLGHIATASGVDIDVRAASLEVNPRLVEIASALGKDPMQWVLAGGDDHPLAAAFPSGAVLPAGWQRIGAVRAAAGAPRVTVDGVVPEFGGGWDHYR